MIFLIRYNKLWLPLRKRDEFVFFGNKSKEFNILIRICLCMQTLMIYDSLKLIN